MKSTIVKHSVVINGHKTSVSLEPAFWSIVREIASGENTTVSAVLRRVDGDRKHSNLSSAVRVYVLEHVRAQVAAQEMPSATLPPPLPTTGMGPVAPLGTIGPRQPRA
jgi:predicted DNA-binding ribbon-helix-helix protein